MLKNKTKIISLLTLIILTFLVPFVIADEPKEETKINVISESNPIEENIKKQDVYFIGDSITIDYVVDGNLFIVAKNVTIDSQIGGSAFILTENLNITEKAYIFNSLFTSAKELNISGVISDLYSVANKINLNSYIYRDIKVSCEEININNTIGRNAFINSNTINFAINDTTDDNQNNKIKGIINGNLNYSSLEEIPIPDGAVVGEKVFNPIKLNTSSIIKTYIYSLGSILVFVSILWLIFRWLTPSFITNSTKLLMKPKNILSTIMNGIISPLIVIMGGAILLSIPITSNIAILLLGIFILMVALSSATLIIVLNQIICNKFKFEKNTIIYAILILFTLAYWILSIIPYVGIVLKTIFTIVGLGILTNRLYPNSSPDKK